MKIHHYGFSCLQTPAMSKGIASIIDRFIPDNNTTVVYVYTIIGTL